MVFFYRSPQAIVISALCSIAIAAFIYFVIVKPETDKAHSQVDKTLQQFQPSINKANKQLEGAQPSINRAQRIQDCIAAAGTDTSKIAACGSK